MKITSLLSILFFSIAAASCGGSGGSGSSTGSTNIAISATATTTAQNLTVGKAMVSFSPLTPSGGTLPYAYSYSGTLPAGLNLNASSGAVTGTPTSTYATANVIFSVKDANNIVASNTSTVSFTVNAASIVTTKIINDTGITASQCYQAGSNVLVACNSAAAIALNNAQDGMVGRDADGATNSNTDGELGFSFASVAGGCVQDNVTGLMWEIKTTDGGLRDKNKTYTNLGNNLAGDASAYQAAVNATNLCGYSDWHLPTADELQSIVDYGIAFPGPTIDGTWFPETQGNLSSGYWTSTLATGISSFAWYVDFYSGSVMNYARGTNLYVRLVRASQAAVVPRYTVSIDGQEVTDNQTNLIWRRCAEGMVFSGGTCTGTASKFTHESALQRAAAQASSTSIAWRLPNVKELASITDKSRSPAIDPVVFPGTPIPRFWSASPVVGSLSYAWNVNFVDGGNDLISLASDRAYSGAFVRLVRDGP